MNPDGLKQTRVKVIPGGGTRPVTKSSTLHRLSTDPFLDWLFILLVTMALSVSLVVVGIYVYVEHRKTLSSSLATTSRKALELPLVMDNLQTLLGEFSKRAAEREALAKSYSAPKDPSLP